MQFMLVILVNSKHHFTNITNMRWKLEEVVINDQDFIRLPRHDMLQHAKALINKGFLRLQPSKKPTFYQH